MSVKTRQISKLPSVVTCSVFQIMVEGVKAGPTVEGDMAFDDVLLSDAECPSTAHCDLEVNMCSWSNVGGSMDQKNWLRGRGRSQNPNTGLRFDHTTNTEYGKYFSVYCPLSLFHCDF